MKALVDDIKLIELPYFMEENGSLVAIEGSTHVPFAIARVFAARASQGAVRGEHAHKACMQFLTCLNGSVEVACDDGHKTAVYILDRADKGLLVPPCIWLKCTYQMDDSVLTVLCDRPYEAHDYIRDYNEFKAYRGVSC